MFIAISLCHIIKMKCSFSVWFLNHTSFYLGWKLVFHWEHERFKGYPHTWVCISLSYIRWKVPICHVILFSIHFNPFFMLCLIWVFQLVNLEIRFIIYNPFPQSHFWHALLGGPSSERIHLFGAQVRTTMGWPSRRLGFRVQMLG
jgi:hypothetical protein